MANIIAMDTQSLGDRSYLVHDAGVGFVVDAQRDIDRLLDAAADAGVRIAHVFETHIHNDYITGGHALAQATGAAYHINSDESVAFDHAGIRDGDVVPIGTRLQISALATPGHTFSHMSYLLEQDGEPVAVFTGGSMLYGSVGRPDLLGPDHTDALAHHQYASVRKLARNLPDDTEVYPTHAFSSFCSAGPIRASSSNIGTERQVNPALTADEQAFVDSLLAGLDDWPAYYAHMEPVNTRGPAAPDLSPVAGVDAGQIRDRIAAGDWVVDLRNRVAFMAGHVDGTISFGLTRRFPTYLGWLIPWGTPLTLLAETPEQIAEAQRELVRIGIERPAGAATGTPHEWAGGQPLASIPRATFADLAQACHHREIVVLDVRSRSEWQAGHLKTALHIPLPLVCERRDEIPDGEVWVHCVEGYRAAIGASLLAKSGRRVVHVDDEFAHVEPADVTTDEPARR